MEQQPHLAEEKVIQYLCDYVKKRFRLELQIFRFAQTDQVS